MTDTTLTIMENIFREMITVIGYEKASEIMKTFGEKPKTEKPKKAEKKEEPVEEKKKRIPRMSPTLANQLKTELTKVGLKYSDDDKKEFEKVKKEFVTYVDDLTEDDFTNKGLTDHMRDFTTTKKPQEEKVVKTEEKPKEEEKVVKIEEKPKKASKKKEKEVEELSPPSNAATIVDLTLKELQAVDMIATPGGEPTGVYWDAGNGRWIRGPDADQDEDLVEMGFKKETYMVGEKTGRVYKESEIGKGDKFLGFVGVGAFRGMKMP